MPVVIGGDPKPRLVTTWMNKLRSAVMVDRSRLAFGPAVSGSVGFVLSIALGVLSGQIQDGLTAALGALMVGIANLGGAYRARAATLLCTSAAVGLAALLGGLTGNAALLTILVSAVWGFGGGLSVAWGPPGHWRWPPTRVSTRPVQSTKLY